MYNVSLFIYPTSFFLIVLHIILYIIIIFIITVLMRLGVGEGKLGQALFVSVFALFYGMAWPVLSDFN